MKKLEAFGLSLAASREKDTHVNPVETCNPPPAVTPAEAENSIRSTTPLQQSTGKTFSEQ